MRSYRTLLAALGLLGLASPAGAFTYSAIYGSTSVVRSDGAVIPNDSGNTEWREYQAWVAEGNTATPASAPTVPVVIQAWQGKYEMKITAYDPSKAEEAYAATVAGKTNVYDALDALIPTLANPQLEAYWAYGTTFRSDSAIISTLATDLGITTEEVNAMFAAAAALQL